MSGETSVTSHANASPRGVAPWIRRSSRRRSSTAVAKLVWASQGCGTTRPSEPTASRATRIHACSSTWARRARRPLRGHASAWSPSGSSAPPHPWRPAPCPQRWAAGGKGRRKRRRRAMCMRLGVKVAPSSLGMAVSHAPAWGPAWDLSSAWPAGGRRGKTSRARKEVCTTSDARCCQPCAGMPGSRSRRLGTSDALAARTAQPGRDCQPYRSSSDAEAAASRRHAAADSGPRVSSAAQRAARIGWRRASTGRASAHAAQYAAGAIRSAANRPRPPSRMGRKPTSRAVAGRGSGSPSRKDKQLHTALSCWRAYSPDWEGGNVRRRWPARGAAV